MNSTYRTQQIEKTSSAKMKVITVVPCFNTELYIGDIVSRTRPYVNQVIVIDDGSQDGTAEAARTAGAQVISHSANRGYGEAIKSCFEAAKANDADILVILDGDGQHSPDEIPNLLAPIIKGEAEIVIGSRFCQPNESYTTAPESSTHPRSQPFDSRLLTVMPGYRRFGISVITFLWNFGSELRVSDAQSGFRAYGKRAFQKLSLSEQGMSISIEILEKARRMGFLIKEVRINCYYTSSRLNAKGTKHGLGVALAVLRIRLKNLFGLK